MSYMFDTPSMLKALQDGLSLNDKNMADYLGVDVTGFREARGGTQDLSAHGAAILLDSLGFLKISDSVMMLLTKKAREKLVTARSKHVLTTAQNEQLSILVRKYGAKRSI